MTTYTILLTDGTVGTLTAEREPEYGATITVELQDVDGNFITKIGKVEEILE